MTEEGQKKISEWCQLIVMGLNNGLTHTIPDGRTDDIEWVRRRLTLWEAFGRCVVKLKNKQSYEIEEKELQEVAKEGYQREKAKEEKN